MIFLKDGVELVGPEGQQLHPTLLDALKDVERLFSQYNSRTVITSAWDGKHSTNSLHYAGRAVDLRVWYLKPNVRKTFTASLKRYITRKYGPIFDVIFEGDHIHLELDPK